MTIDPAFYAVLYVAVDDWWGLWELLPEIENALAPADRAGIESARRIVEEMLGEGLIAVYMRDGPSGTPMAVEQPLSGLLLRDEASWGIPNAGDTQVLVAATQAGERLYSEATRDIERR